MGKQGIAVDNQRALNKKAYVNIENWRKRPLTGRYPYAYVDGIYLKRNWGGEYKNVSILLAVGVTEDGYHEVLGAQEGITATAFKNKPGKGTGEVARS